MPFSPWFSVPWMFLFGLNPSLWHARQVLSYRTISPLVLSSIELLTRLNTFRLTHYFSLQILPPRWEIPVYLFPRIWCSQSHSSLLFLVLSLTNKHASLKVDICGCIFLLLGCPCLRLSSKVKPLHPTPLPSLVSTSPWEMEQKALFWLRTLHLRNYSCDHWCWHCPTRNLQIQASCPADT